MEFRRQFGRDEPGPARFDSPAPESRFGRPSGTGLGMAASNAFDIAPGSAFGRSPSAAFRTAPADQPGVTFEAAPGTSPAGAFASGEAPEPRSVSAPSRSLILGAAFVAGFQHHHGMHPRVLWTLRPGDPLHLVREPGNPYDRFATALYTQNGARLGYVPRGLNEPIANLIDQELEVFTAIAEVDPEAEPWKRVRIVIWAEVPLPAVPSEN